MIFGLRHGVNHLRMTMGVERGVRHDFLEKIRRHQAGTGEGQQQAAWTQRPHRQPVNIFIAPAGAFQLPFRFGEFRRIENHDIELPLRIAIRSQHLKHVADDRLDLFRIQSIQFDIAAGKLHRLSGRLDIRHSFCAMFQGINAKAAGIGKAIQHVRAVRTSRQQRPIFALIEVKSGFMTALNID